MKKFLQRNGLLILLLFLIGLVVRPLFFPGYFSHHDDLQVMRILEMRKCFEDGQIPCRWVPDMGYGYGFPLYNYYGVFPYYIGAFFSLFLGYINSAKLLFFLPLFLGPIFIFIFLKEFLGKEKSAFFGALLYTFAPYRALDVYVRGDVTESFAMAFMPLLLFLSLRMVKFNNLKIFTYFSLVIGLFLMTHNIMTLFFMPLLLVWILYCSWIYKSFYWKSFLISFLLGFSLAAYFIIPAFIEKNLVHIETLKQGDLDFREHFASVGQIFFSRFWGYGASLWGSRDGLSFQVGWPHWFMVILSIFLLVIYVVRGKLIKEFDFYRYIEIKELNRNYFLFTIFFVLVFGMSVFLMHNKSAFLWEKIEILHFAQFPWRFLSLAILSSSIIGALFVSVLKSRVKFFVIFVLILLTIFLNWNYFKPKEYFFDMTDDQKLSGNLWVDQQKAAALDYLPKSAGVIPKSVINSEYELLTPNTAVIKNSQKGTDWVEIDIKVIDHTILRINRYYFPDWKIFIDGKDSEFIYKDNNLGLMSVILGGPKDYHIEARLLNTPIRLISNIVSLLGIIIFCGIGLIQIPILKKYLSYYIKSLD